MSAAGDNRETAASSFPLSSPKKEPDGIQPSYYRMTAQEQKEYEEVRAWWTANVVLKDGYLVTSHGGPILPGHTWNTLVYEPQARLLIHGTGAYCSDAAVLHSRYHNRPPADVERQTDKSYTSIWMFDPARRRWIIHKRPK